MRNKFYELINNFTKELNIESACEEGDTHADLVLSGFKLKLALEEVLSSLIIQAPVAVVPFQKNEELYLTLLKRNNLFQNTWAISYSLDIAQDVINMQFSIPLEKVNDKNFGNMIMNYLNVVMENITNIDDLLLKQKQETNKVTDTNSFMPELMYMMRV